ncbi:hypothetical protein M5K25_016834 [Dendrobium thyrsiflorum]|uniref:Uncharacterized protein n=1 Tax=Dendrobium thyrsiflorum TaxID=117978 RepID=A0ABD0USY1_DENTH
MGSTFVVARGVIFSWFCSSGHSSSSTIDKEPPAYPDFGRREVVLRSFAVPAMAAIFNFSGTKPGYLGVQKNSSSLALCPATSNCVSTSEDISDSKHYAPPWNYNPDNGGERKL